MAMLYLDAGIPVNSVAFNDEETWFELIGTAGRTFSPMHASGAFAEAAGTELCKGNDEEMADVELDCAGTYIRKRCEIILVFHWQFSTLIFLAL